jgi:hypothetical protein
MSLQYVAMKQISAGLGLHINLLVRSERRLCCDKQANGQSRHGTEYLKEPQSAIRWRLQSGHPARIGRSCGAQQKRQGVKADSTSTAPAA